MKNKNSYKQGLRGVKKEVSEYTYYNYMFENDVLVKIEAVSLSLKKISYPESSLMQKGCIIVSENEYQNVKNQL